MILFAVSGILTGLGTAFPEVLGPTQWLSLTPAVYSLIMMANDKESFSLRKIYLYGLLFFECYLAVVFHWFIYLYPMDFTGISNFVSVVIIILGCLGLPFIQSIGAALAFLFFTAIERGEVARRHPYISPATLPALYMISEFLQCFGWWGVPWGRLALGQTYALPFVQNASLLGSYFISGIIVFVNTALAYAFINIKKNLRRSQIYSLLALGVFSLNLITGALRMPKPDSQSETVTVGLVQASYSSIEPDENPYAVLAKYEAMTYEAKEAGADIVLWPEISLPFRIIREGALEERLCELAKSTDTHLFVGALLKEGADIYNTLIHFSPSGVTDENIYRKQKLVPFGEYIPMGDFLTSIMPFLEDITINGDLMTEGDSAVTFDVEGVGKIGALICFDSVYESTALGATRAGAELILLGTNDSWFSDSAAIYMHNNQARLRAIEVGRYIARAANTGVSTIISPSGEILESTEVFEKRVLIGEVGVSSDRTLYSYLGNAIIYASAFFIISLAIYDFIYKNKKTEDIL